MRLFENKSEYQLNCEDVAVLLNNENGNNYGESSYRKFYAAFNQGRHYEMEKDFAGVATRVLALSDFHVPYQLHIETFEDYKNRVDVLVLNGDLVDHQAISKFQKSYRVSPMEELIHGREYFINLIEYICPKRVVITVGNHDARFGAYLAKNLDSDMLELMPDTSLELMFVDGFHHYNKRTRTKTWYEPIEKIFRDEVEIEYSGSWKAKVGRVWFAHPQSYSSGTLKTTERAMTHFFKTDQEGFCGVVLAHTHKTAHSKNGFINLYEQGCCCDVSQLKYAEGRLIDPAKSGFLYMCQDKDGNIIDDKTKIIYLN